MEMAGVRKNGLKLLLINGLEVRVLPGSPLFPLTTFTDISLSVPPEFLPVGS
jgi:hypothetical protein